MSTRSFRRHRGSASCAPAGLRSMGSRRRPSRLRGSKKCSGAGSPSSAAAGTTMSASMAAADMDADFAARYPEYLATAHLDALRASEYGRLDRSGHVYLDYTGGSLHAESQVRTHL